LFSALSATATGRLATTGSEGALLPAHVAAAAPGEVRDPMSLRPDPGVRQDRASCLPQASARSPAFSLGPAAEFQSRRVRPVP
jgi:hypothetical protein